MQLLDTSVTGFSYPTEFMELISRDLIDFDPWIIIEGELLKLRYVGLKERYPERQLIPFAQRLSNDDVACWEKGIDNKVFVIHDFASSGWEKRYEYDNFWGWLRQTVNDMIEFIEEG